MLTVAKMSSVETISIETEPAAMRPGQRAKAGIRRLASHVEPSPRSDEHGMPSKLRREQSLRSGREPRTQTLGAANAYLKVWSVPGTGYLVVQRRGLLGGDGLALFFFIRYQAHF